MKRRALEEEIGRLERALAERKASLPAHSVRPHQWIGIEDLEEQLRSLRRRLDAVEHEGADG